MTCSSSFRLTSDAYDPVTEAGIESFPASDPPAFTPVHAVGGRHAGVVTVGWDSDFVHRFREVDVRLLPWTGQVHLALLESQDYLAAALREMRDDQRTISGAALLECLTMLRLRLIAHRTNIQADGSLSDAIKSQDPWLLSHIQHLLRHHDWLERAIANARAEYETAEDSHRAEQRTYKHAKGIAAALATMLSVERTLLMSQFCDPPALD